MLVSSFHDAVDNTANFHQELGIEGFDRLVDRYHDTAHDHAIQYGRKIHRPKRWRKTAQGDTVEVVEEPHPEAVRASSEPRIDAKGEPPRRHGENNFSDSEDQGYASEVRPKRRPRRYSGNQSREFESPQQRKVRISPYQEVCFPAVKFDAPEPPSYYTNC